MSLLSRQVSGASGQHRSECRRAWGPQRCGAGSCCWHMVIQGHITLSTGLDCRQHPVLCLHLSLLLLSAVGRCGQGGVLTQQPPQPPPHTWCVFAWRSCLHGSSSGTSSSSRESWQLACVCACVPVWRQPWRGHVSLFDQEVRMQGGRGSTVGPHQGAANPVLGLPCGRRWVPESLLPLPFLPRGCSPEGTQMWCTGGNNRAPWSTATMQVCVCGVVFLGLVPACCCPAPQRSHTPPGGRLVVFQGLGAVWVQAGGGWQLWALHLGLEGEGVQLP
jgi:hypothetical protein